MNILLALSGLKSEAQFQNASTSAQTAWTYMAESAESSSGVEKSPPFGEVHFIPGKEIG